MSETINVPAIAADASAVTRIKSEIDISDRSRIVTFGDRAQRSVVEFADRILAQTQNRELGTTGKLLSDILAKARGLDPATLKDGKAEVLSTVRSLLRGSCRTPTAGNGWNSARLPSRSFSTRGRRHSRRTRSSASIARPTTSSTRW